jgi:hypothetical protein
MLATETTDTIAGGDPILFSNNGVLHNITHIPDTAGITVANTGAYQIDYDINATGGPNSIISLAVNGIVNSTTLIKVLTANTHVCGSVILNLNAGDIISVVNDSAFTLKVDDSPNIGAQINIIQLS